MFAIDQNIRHASSKIDAKYKVDRKSNGKFLFRGEKKEKLGNYNINAANNKRELEKIKEKN